MNKKVIAGVVIVAVLGAGGWWYVSKRGTAAAANTGTRYLQEAVKRGTIRAQVAGSGPVKSVNGITVKSSQSGTILQILAAEGEKVQAGQSILVLENKTLLTSLAQAQLDAQSARTNLDNLVNPLATALRAQELKVESAQVTLQQRQDEVANLMVMAPSTSVIATINVKTGASINSNALLFTMFDETTPTLVISLPQETANALTSGQKATVTLAGFGTIQGKVVRHGGTATPVSGNRDANVPVAIDLPAVEGIRPGMVGQVVIEVPGLAYRIQGSGSVENDSEEVRAKVAGTVESIKVAEGQKVTAGEHLLTIENDNLRVQLSQAENDLKSQEQNLATLQDPSQDPDRKLTTYQQKLQQAQLNLSQKQSDVDDLTVKASVDGTVSALTAQVGDKVTNSTNLFRVADYNAMEVTIAVDELDVARIKVGHAAEIALDALPGKSYKGKVTRINPEGIFKNDIATFEVTILIEKPEGLMAGMNATVNVIVEERVNALSLPVAAVRITKGKAFVNVLQGDQLVQKEVQVGVKTNDRYEVLGGLNEGDQVVTTIIRPKTQTGLPFGGGGGGGGPLQQNQGSSFGAPQSSTPSGSQGGSR